MSTPIEFNNLLQEFNCTLDKGLCQANKADVSTERTLPGTAVLVQIVIMSLFFSSGLLGNLYAVYVMAASSKVQILSRYVISRSIADILMILTVPFDAASHLQGSWNFGTFLCKVRSAICLMSPFASSVLLVGMCVNNYIEVCKSGPHIKLRSALFKVISLLTWFLFLMFGTSIMIQSEIVREVDMERFHCISIPLMENTTPGLVFRLLTICFVFFIPFIFSWVFILLTLLNKESFTVYSARLIASGALKTETKLKQFLVTLTLAFTICQALYWIPYMALEFTTDVDAVQSIMALFHLTVSLPVINAAINSLCIVFIKDSEVMFGKIKGRLSRDPPMIPLIPIN